MQHAGCIGASVEDRIERPLLQPAHEGGALSLSIGCCPSAGLRPTSGEQLQRIRGRHSESGKEMIMQPVEKKRTPRMEACSTAQPVPSPIGVSVRIGFYA